jgi:hypothetical protein
MQNPFLTVTVTVTVSKDIVVLASVARFAALVQPP